jgi:hypothetical protein
MKKPDQPIQFAIPAPGLTTAELAQDVLSRIERGNTYARSRKNRFRYRSSVVKMTSLALSVASTIILGLQELNVWTGVAFALVAVVTVRLDLPKSAHGDSGRYGLVREQYVGSRRREATDRRSQAWRFC